MHIYVTGEMVLYVKEKGKEGIMHYGTKQDYRNRKKLFNPMEAS